MGADDEEMVQYIVSFIVGMNIEMKKIEKALDEDDFNNNIGRKAKALTLEEFIFITKMLGLFDTYSFKKKR